MIYIGGMLLQYPIGWISDRMDRRLLIIYLTLFGAVAMAVAPWLTHNIYALMGLMFIVGGIANPLYSLYIAYTNDFLQQEDMAAASGGLIFVNGLGAVGGPFLVGWLMSNYGADSFFVFLAALMGMSAVWAIARSTVRDAPSVDETYAYAPVSPGSTAVAVEVAAEHAMDMAEESEEPEAEAS
jgi:MFS family permease